MKKDLSLNDIKKVLGVLSTKDKFFVSEAHLQTEFIIEAAKLFPNYKFFPELVPGEVPDEYKEKYKDKGTHFDLLIKTGKENVLIEFKYLTDSFTGYIDGMEQSVKSHMAVDIRRHDCWADIERIELFAKSSKSIVNYGYFILVTNAPAYWNNNHIKADSCDSAFRIHEGFHSKEVKSWREGTGKGTNHGRTTPIVIQNDYHFKYETFSELSGKKGLFKSLVIEIE